MAGCVSFLSAFAAFKTVPKFGRKRLLVVGQITMGTSLLLTSISIYAGAKTFSVLFMLLFLICYQSTMGPTHWIYIPEILTDAQFGFVVTIHYLNGVEIGLSTEYLIEIMAPSGTFLMFAVITLLGGVFMHLFVKETQGLTDREKKNLYSHPQQIDNSIYVEALEEETIHSARSVDVSEIELDGI